MSIVLGVAFLLSGLANMLVLNTSMNILAFRLPNIGFSVLVGLLLLVLGSYGRISGGLPVDSPYRGTGRDEPAPVHGSRDPEVTRELAEAERAFALHYATQDQVRRLLLVHAYRSAEDRCRAWESSADPVLAPSGAVPAPVAALSEPMSVEAAPQPVLADVPVVAPPEPRRPRSWPRLRRSVAR